MEGSNRRRRDDVGDGVGVALPIEPNAIMARGGGRVKDREREPVIIGGMVLDIHATPSIPPNPGTTSPGKVCYVLGGVARNVAECVSKLGTKPFLISAVGVDMAGDLLLKHWRSSGLSIKGICNCQDINTAVVCNMFDAEGELAAAVASFETIEKFLTADWITKFRCNISAAPVVMADANLNQLALEASCKIAANSDVPVWFEPVSVSKSRKVASVVKYITFASPNEDELIAMANSLSCGEVFSPIRRHDSTSCSIGSLFQMLKPAILVLLERGIKVVLVTLGSDGVFLCFDRGLSLIGSKKFNPGGLSGRFYELVASSCPQDWFPRTAMSKGSSHVLAVHFPALPASVVKLTGAGDCLVGGTLASFSAGLDVFQSVAVGVAAAKGAVETVTNVPAEFHLSKLADDARKVYAAAKVLFHPSML